MSVGRQLHTLTFIPFNVRVRVGVGVRVRVRVRARVRVRVTSRHNGV